MKLMLAVWGLGPNRPSIGKSFEHYLWHDWPGPPSVPPIAGDATLTVNMRVPAPGILTDLSDRAYPVPIRQGR